MYGLWQDTRIEGHLYSMQTPSVWEALAVSFRGETKLVPGERLAEDKGWQN